MAYMLFHGRPESIVAHRSNSELLGRSIPEEKLRDADVVSVDDFRWLVLCMADIKTCCRN